MTTRDPCRRVAVFSKPHAQAPAVLKRIAAVARRRGVETVVDEQSARSLGRDAWMEREDAVHGADVVISVGGDGTLLAAARAVGASEIPILGINLGHLGFLTETVFEQVDQVLQAAIDGHATIEPRRVLAIRRDGEPSNDDHVALNDVVFSKRQLARLFALSMFVDGEWVTDYRADGLILSTPTGSTAYNLAAGGPVIYPGVDAIVATPICPHSLSQRPIILPGDSTVTVTVADGAGEGSVQVTLDGQIGLSLDAGGKIVISRAKHAVYLIRPPGRSFYSVLRDKLGWGHP